MIDVNGAWTYTLDNTDAAVQALNVGDTLTDSFTATTIDGTSQVVTLTITGANDAAVITGVPSTAWWVRSGVPTAPCVVADALPRPTLTI